MRRVALLLADPAEHFDHFVCPVCGHPVGHATPEPCEICSTKATIFVRIC